MLRRVSTRDRPPPPDAEEDEVEPPPNPRAKRDEEDDTEPPPKVKRSPHITPEGAKKLRTELDWLWTKERPRVTQAVSDAAALGDRSENADYIYGKRRLREIDRRLHFLRKRLDEVKIVTEPPDDPRHAFFGAWVTVLDEDGASKVYRIVGADESNLELGLISIDSPVARALLGKRTGDEVTVRVPKGDVTYTITNVEYR